MPDLLNEQKISRWEAADLLGVGADVVVRYIRLGTVSGIRLEAYRRNKSWITSREAVRRFLDAQTERELPRPARGETPARRRKSVAERLARATAACEAQGA